MCYLISTTDCRGNSVCVWEFNFSKKKQQRKIKHGYWQEIKSTEVMLNELLRRVVCSGAHCTLNPVGCRLHSCVRECYVGGCKLAIGAS